MDNPNSQFQTHWQLTKVFSYRSEATLHEACAQAMRLANVDEDHEGRKWAWSNGVEQCIIAGHKSGYVVYDHAGNLFLHPQYAITDFWNNNGNRIRSVIDKIMEDGLPMMGVMDLFEAAVRDIDLVTKYLYQMEQALGLAD